ncbi:MAG: hypothetical protein N3F62_06140 [Bacteroidia bacterium]|jgi:hypothetical protein|nr:hypothetical protein [Bacteroidia bacterium]
MHPQIHSIAVVSSLENILLHYEEFVQFFNAVEIEKKDLFIYSKKPILDYSKIKKISADEVIVIYQKDFLPFNLFLKPTIYKVLNTKQYSVVIHFNSGESVKNTYLIAKTILSEIKISDHIQHQKTFSVILHNAANYLSEVLNFLRKIEL